jgi:hypothetical protein
MKLCALNNLLICLIIIVLAYSIYNISVNKKNVDTFTNSVWKLNSDGKLCNNNECHKIALITDDNTICDVNGSNCVEKTTN